MKSESYRMFLRLALLGAMFESGSGQIHRHELSQKEIDKLKEISKLKAKDLMLSKGCKEFNIDGIIVIALNEKNAIRKANNIKKQITNHEKEQ